MKTIFVNLKTPYGRLGVMSVNICKVDIRYRDDGYLRLVEGGDTHDNGADARGTVINLLRNGDDEVRFSLELAREFYHTYYNENCKCELRDFFDDCFKQYEKGIEKED